MIKSFISSNGVASSLISLILMAGTATAHHKHKHKHGKRLVAHRHLKHMKNMKHMKM